MSVKSADGGAVLRCDAGWQPERFLRLGPLPHLSSSKDHTDQRPSLYISTFTSTYAYIFSVASIIFNISSYDNHHRNPQIRRPPPSQGRPCLLCMGPLGKLSAGCPESPDGRSCAAGCEGRNSDWCSCWLEVSAYALPLFITYLTSAAVFL